MKLSYLLLKWLYSFGIFPENAYPVLEFSFIFAGFSPWVFVEAFFGINLILCTIWSISAV